MNGVYGKRVKPLDVRLVRGDSERLGAGGGRGIRTGP